jgi:ATP-dependent protease Clp ATPase subunit
MQAQDRRARPAHDPRHVLLDTMYDLPSMENVSKVVVDEASSRGENKPYIIYESDESARRGDATGDPDG